MPSPPYTLCSISSFIRRKMPGVICYRTPPQDCALLGHLYRSSPNAERLVRSERRPRMRGSWGSSSSSPAHRSEPCGLQRTSGSAAVSLALLLFLCPEIVLLVLAELPGPDILRCRSVSPPLLRVHKNTVLTSVVTYSTDPSTGLPSQPGLSTD